VLLSILAICLIGYVFFGIVSNHAVGVHQRSVTRSLAEWKQEYGNISSHRDAIRTAEMLEYVQRYYVPAEGYRSSPEIETALQMQRQETVESFVAALRRFSGKDFGTDSGQWLKYLSVQKTEKGWTE
jgi:hypothetical protein